MVAWTDSGVLQVVVICFLVVVVGSYLILVGSRTELPRVIDRDPYR